MRTILIVFLFYTTTFAQDSLFIGKWEYDFGEASKNELSVQINADSTFVVNSINNDTEEFLTSRGNWELAETGDWIKMMVKYRKGNNYETLYYDKFPKMSLAWSPTMHEMILIETSYVNCETSTQTINLIKRKINKTKT